MPRTKNPLAVAVGKLILAIQKEAGEVRDESDESRARDVMNRAHTLQHAAHNNCVPALLNGQSIVEYLDAVWVATHPAMRISVDAVTSELSLHK